MSTQAMSWWNKICLAIISLPVKFFVKGKPIPTDLITELNIDPKKPILYILPYSSKIDLLVIRSLCLKHQLPDPLSSINTGTSQTLPAFIYINKGPSIFSFKKQKEYALSTLTKYIEAHKKNRKLNIQVLPVAVMFNRKPDKEGKKKPSLQTLGSIHKLFKMVFSGRDCYARFSKTISLKELILSFDKPNHLLAHKLLRVAHIHFAKQRMASVGPMLPNRQKMLNKLLKEPVLKEAINEEAKNKNIAIEKAEKNALSMLNEIAADFSYRMLRLTDIVLTWAWNRLYQGLKVTNADPVRELAQNGHEIVYVPCHRSHMDYLLLSYVLYRQGLVPPHIAAGINLNFWPAGPIFRRLGAFFIRRSFKGNKLYTAVFREYLAELFIRGYSVEYFIEGGRSRTGRLLDPKTGLLMMTIQTLLRENARPISIVPIYIGYEHVLEVATYANELRGATKQKESLWGTLRAFFKLKKLGYGYVNFGKPILLNQFLDEHVQDWKSCNDNLESQKPSWLTPTTNKLAIEIMENINASAAANAINLCSLILLSSQQRALTKKQLIEHIDYALTFLHNVPYNNLVTFPDIDAHSLFTHAEEMGKFVITIDDAGEIVSLTPQQSILMTYYRNNIQHLFIIPSLVARIIIKHNRISPEELINKVENLYPIIKSELFLYFDQQQLIQYIDTILQNLVNLNFISYGNERITINYFKMNAMELIAAFSRDTLQRYAIAFSLLQQNPGISRVALEKESRLIAQRLSVLFGINAPEFFDKGVFAMLVSALKEQGYLNDEDEGNQEKIQRMNDTLKPLITTRVMQIIEETHHK